MIGLFVAGVVLTGGSVLLFLYTVVVFVSLMVPPVQNPWECLLALILASVASLGMAVGVDLFAYSVQTLVCHL